MPILLITRTHFKTLYSRGIALHDGKLPLVLEVHGKPPDKGEPPEKDQQPHKPRQILVVLRHAAVLSVRVTLVALLRTDARRADVERNLDEAKAKARGRAAFAGNGAAKDVCEEEAEPAKEERHHERRDKSGVIAKGKLVACKMRSKKFSETPGARVRSCMYRRRAEGQRYFTKTSGRLKRASSMLDELDRQRDKRGTESRDGIRQETEGRDVT